MDVRTGKVLRTIDGGGQFVRTAAAPDLDGDGKAEIVIPTDAVRVYRGDGKLAWTYKPRTDVVFGDVSFGKGTVYAQYSSRGSLGLPASSVALAAVSLDASSGAVKWQATPTVPEGLGLDGVVYGAVQRAATFASPEIPYADGHAVVYTWLSRPAPALPPAMFMEIRDGRTGEVLRSARLGGPHNLGAWFTGPDGLSAVTTGTITTFGPGTEPTILRTVPTMWNAGIATTPAGERILVAGADGGLVSFPAASLTTPPSGFTPSVSSINAIGAASELLADLDGDGRVEAVSLNQNARGTDRSAQLFGSAYSTPFTAMRSFIVATVDAP